MIEVTSDVLKKVYKPRPTNSRKLDFGLLNIIGGSDFYSGSPALSALAAFRTGVDMVRIIAPKRAADIIASFSPIMAAYPLEGKWLEEKHLSILISMIEAAKDVSKGKTAVVIGGGLGRTKETQKAIISFLSEVDVPAVIDADAIHAISTDLKVISGRDFLITPNLYEFFILTGKEVYKSKEKEKIDLVREEAKRLKTTILLKGPVDVISDGKEVALDRTGTGYMAKGGCGDTLAGICGAIIARGIDPFLAGQAGSFINGKAGELAAERLKESLTATDLIDAISEIINS